MSHLNSIVTAIGEVHLEGNITPHAWYQAPALQFANGKANLAAITLLADLVYWYRPTILRDEATGRVVEIRQKFRADKLQKDYKKWGAQFGLSKGQTEDAVHFLRNAGLLTVETRTIEVMGRNMGNVVFLEPVVEAIKAITSLVVPPQPPDDTPSSVLSEKGTDSNTPPSSDRTEEGSGSIGGASTDRTGDSPPIERCNTYNTTETSSKISSKTTTIPARTQAAPNVEAPVVVSLQMQRDTIPDTACERPTKRPLEGRASPSKPNTSGMTPLVDMLPPVSPPAPSEAPGDGSEALVGPPPKVKAQLEAMGVRIGQESPAVAALMQHGVKPVSAAKRLVAAHGERLCLDWIEALPYCKYDDAARYLVAALETGYKLPDALFAARKDKQRRAQQQAEEKRRAELRVQAAEAKKRERMALLAAWKALPDNDKEKQAVRSEALRRVSPKARQNPTSPGYAAIIDGVIISIMAQKGAKRGANLVMQSDQNTMQKAA